jgi:hypothetical protein
MMRELETFEGFTIDDRLREFRRVYRRDGNFGIEFVPFDSAKGKRLMKKLRGFV